MSHLTSDGLISFAFSFKFLCIMKLENVKGKRVKKTLKTWESHFYTINTDISLGGKIGSKMGKLGCLYWKSFLKLKVKQIIGDFVTFCNLARTGITLVILSAFNHHII